MKVTLISATQDAAALLLFTKNTRLNMSADNLGRFKAMTAEQMLPELRAMARTIRSSWEFVDVIFAVEGLTRSTAQQVTRSRQASFAMQSLRVVDASDIDIINPYEEEPDSSKFGAYAENAENCRDTYQFLMDSGSSKEDARDALPMGTSSNLVAKYNLRAFADLVAARSSLRAQGPYREMVAEMRRQVVELWPWAEEFFRPANEEAITMLEEVVKSIGLTTGSGPGWEIAKAIDLLRKGA
jgi:flavin-dependent thymidylate synthase